jgi:hypothetical protein
MNPQAHYSLEKFRDAVHDLATLPGDARSRLLIAYGRFWHLTPDRLPSPISRDVKWIRQQLTRGVPVGDRDRVRTRLAKMRNATAAIIAKRIYRVYDRLSEMADC